MRIMKGVQALALTFLALGCAQNRSESSGNVQMMPMVAPSREVALRENMRELWADHVVWTRDYIVAATSGHPSAQAALDRLMKNQEDLGAAIVPFYGNAAGNQLTALLKDHIRIAGELVTAAKAGNQASVASADRRWLENAADIATFLSNANPHWPKADLVSMLNEHLRLTRGEATARLKEDWVEERRLFDQIFDQSMAMADALTEGLLAHHPERVP